MRWWRRKRLVRLGLAGAVVPAGVLVWLLLAHDEKAYVPGERAEGIVDSLGRTIPDDRPHIVFRDVTAGSGLDFRHFPGVRSNRLPEDMGSGVALGDADGDGWTDVFLANLSAPLGGDGIASEGPAAPCRLFRNLGGGRFEDRTAGSGVELRALAMGAAWVDVDADGDLDLFVTTYGRCHLFRNDGDFRFSDISNAAGVDAFEGFWAGIAVGDYDLDGAMDIYVCGYVRFREDLGAEAESMRLYGTSIPAPLNPSVFAPERNLLFHNRGDGSFEEVAAAAGVANDTGRGLGATFADLSGDGLPDLYVANDVSDNALFVNQGDGTFADQTSSALLGDYRGAMGMAVADFDRDEDLDIYVTHWVAQENALYRNVSRELSGGAGQGLVFMDEADRHGLGQAALNMIGWATGFLDFDNDGWCDLFVVNGSTIPDEKNPELLVPMRPQLFWNAGTERGFFEIGGLCGSFFQQKIVGRGGAAFDYDLDGDQDLVILVHGERAHLLRNDGGNEGGCLLLRLRQPGGNRFAIGARVIASWGGHRMLREVGAQASYLSQHAVGELPFGLGQVPQVDSIQVRWPDGREETAGPFPAGSIVEWERGQEPRAVPFPGLGASEIVEPRSVAEQRQFFALLREASAARIGGDLAAAEAAYRRALSLWPSHQDCLYYLANTLLEQDREAEALELLVELVRRYPRSSRGWMQIGRIRLPGGDPTLDDLAQAGAAFARCHEINGEESGPVVQLGVVAMLAGRLEEADSYFADALALNHRSAEAAYYRGWIAHVRGEKERALTFLRQAHALVAGEGSGVSVSNEGDTRSGGAMMASIPGRLGASPLHRWQTLAARGVDPEAEYGSFPVPVAGSTDGQ